MLYRNKINGKLVELEPDFANLFKHYELVERNPSGPIHVNVVQESTSLFVGGADGADDGAVFVSEEVSEVEVDDDTPARNVSSRRRK